MRSTPGRHELTKILHGLPQVFQILQWENRGIKINGEFISHLRFADDIIFANSGEELQGMLRKLNQASLQVGLSINLNKIKIMTNKHLEEDKNQMITIYNNEIEEVDHYIYLGQHISMDAASKEQKIKRCTTFGGQAFGIASAIFKNKEILPRTQMTSPQSMHSPSGHLWGRNWRPNKKANTEAKNYATGPRKDHTQHRLAQSKNSRMHPATIRDILETISKVK